MRTAGGAMKSLVERLRDEIEHPDTSGAPYVNDTDLLAECLAAIEGPRPAAVAGGKEAMQPQTARLDSVSTWLLRDALAQWDRWNSRRTGADTGVPFDAVLTLRAKAMEDLIAAVRVAVA